MSIAISSLDGVRVIQTEPLSYSAFAQFGTVITNPSPGLIPSPSIKNDLPPDAVLANQSTALKYVNVGLMEDLYSEAPSKKPAQAIMSMFVCAPRKLRPSTSVSVDGVFAVEILERHPFTSQTFIPLGLAKSHSREAQYLVIVAPSLPASSPKHFPVPEQTPKGTQPKRNSGLPDLKGIRAFIADGSQAVTYGAGTWHAPMVVVGKRPVDFVVTQFANGQGIEDCQEVNLHGNQKNGLHIAISNQNFGLWKL